MQLAPLSRRETEVAELVAKGLTNREIATRLFISERTVESHVEQIRNKLGFNSRTQIAGWIVETRLKQSAPVLPVVRREERRLVARRWTVRRRGLVIALAILGVAAGSALAVLVITMQTPTRAPIVTTVAGSGVIAFSADGSRPTETALARPLAIALDRKDQLYMIDGDRVRKVGSTAVITVVGTGQSGYSGDGAPATAARLNAPRALAFDSQGNLFIADTLNHAVRCVDAHGVITTVAGTGEAGSSGDGGPATSARLSSPSGVAVGFGGTLYIVDSGNNRIRSVAANGSITSYAGTGEPRYAGDGGPATSAPLNSPQGLGLRRLEHGLPGGEVKRWSVRHRQTLDPACDVDEPGHVCSRRKGVARGLGELDHTDVEVPRWQRRQLAWCKVPGRVADRHRSNVRPRRRT